MPHKDLSLFARLGVVGLLVAVLLGVSAIPLAGVRASEELESAKDIIAAQVRRQGYECKTAKSAKRDEQASKPDEEVSVLTCSNATYRVRLVPDQAAKIERLD